jgi:uncharacterized protein YidB (DUF937 family)
MSLLSQVLGGVLGGAGGGSSPMQNVLMSMLAGGGQQGGMGGMLGGMGGSGSQGGGGLADLVSGFRQAGLGHIADSWVGTGPNHPVSPDQLSTVLGQDRVRDMASQAGMEPSDLLSQLSQHLPRAVDGMTPNGRLPDEGTVSV